MRRERLDDLGQFLGERPSIGEPGELIAVLPLGQGLGHPERVPVPPVGEDGSRDRDEDETGDDAVQVQVLDLGQDIADAIVELEAHRHGDESHGDGDEHRKIPTVSILDLVFEIGFISGRKGRVARCILGHGAS